MSQPQRHATRSKAADHTAPHHEPAKPAHVPVSPLALRAPAVQTQLAVNQPGDPLEREAEAVADTVMGSPAPAPPPEALPGPVTGIQRQPLPEEEETVQRQPLPEEEETVQRQGNGRPAVPPPTAATIRNPGLGQPLPSAVRRQIEPHLGANLSGVQVHTGPAAHRAANSLQARAFTYGPHIFLNRAESSADARLMAHEATHVIQQGAAAGPVGVAVSAPPPGVQRLLGFVGSELNDYARHIPGYTLFTVIIGVNPLTGEQVERNATNLLEGLMGLAPFGTFLFDKLRELGILPAAFAWVQDQLSRLDLSPDRLERTLEAAWEDIRLSEGFEYNLGVVKRHFGQLYADVVAFARSLVDRIIQFIKDAAIGLAEKLLAENRAWALIKKILHYDPLKGVAVEATTVEILEDFLRLIGKEQELAQMHERGSLATTAAWLDTQIGTLGSLLGELQGLFSAAWAAIQPENLPNLLPNLEQLAGRVGGFLQRVWSFAVTVAAKVLELIKNALLSWLSSFAREIPGYHLLTVILGRDPFTQEAVPATPTNLIRGFMSLMPGGEQQFQQMQQTGVIPQAAARIEGLITSLGISWSFVRDLFLGIWNSLTIDDLIDPIGAFQRIMARFGEPLGRLFTFVIEVIKVVLDLVLTLMNFPIDIIGRIIANALQAFEDIKRDPVGFLIHMLAAVKLGFTRFFDNILQYLLSGLTDWLFGQLRRAGIEPPTEITLESVLGLVMQILGISMERIWEKLAQRIGQDNVDRIRRFIDRLTGIWNFVRDVQERGVAAIWEYIESQISNLWNMVLEQVRGWIMERIIDRVVARLLGMLDPTGIMAVVNSFIAFFNAIQSAIEYFREILLIVDDYVSTIAAVARGDVTPGAAKLEQGLAKAIPVAIGFLANQVGLNRLGDQMQEIIAGIRALVDRALDWLVDRAVSLGRAVLNSLGLGQQDKETAGNIKVQAQAAIEQKVGNGKSLQELEEIVAQVYQELQPLGLHSLTLRPTDEGEFSVYASASEEEEILDAAEPTRADDPIVTRLTARISIQDPLEGLDMTEPEDVRRLPVGAKSVEEFLAAQEAIPPAERILGQVYRERRGRARRTALLVARPSAGADRIVLRTYSGTGRGRGFTTDNSSHAEVRLKEFLESRLEWTQRISRIEIHLKYSPCHLCVTTQQTMSAIRAMLVDITDKSNAVLTWEKRYPNPHIATTPEDFSTLAESWAISGPGAEAAKEEGAKYKVKKKRIK